MTDTTSTVANAVVTIIAFMRSHRVKTIGQAYDLPQFPVGALCQALPGYEYPEISGLTARQLTRRAQPVTEQVAPTPVFDQALVAQLDRALAEQEREQQAEHADGQHLHHEPGCGLCERERLADGVAVEAAAAGVTGKAQPATTQLYAIEWRLSLIQQQLEALAENVMAKGKDLPTAHSINLAVAHLEEQRADLRQVERDLHTGRLR